MALPGDSSTSCALAWDPTADGSSPTEAKVLRQLLTVNGRPPRPRDEPQCTDPESVSTDALSMLLPQKRGDYEFSPGGPARLDNRAALTIDFRYVSKETPEVVLDRRLRARHRSGR